MALSAFDDRVRPPSVTALSGVLGRSAPLWTSLVDGVASLLEGVTEDWTFAGRNYGWSMRLRVRDRNLVYLTPCKGHFLVGVVLGERAIEAAQSRGASADVLSLVEASPRYVEGRGVRLTVRSAADVRRAVELVRIKLLLTS